MADPNVPKFVVGEEEVSGEKVKTGLSSLNSAGGAGGGRGQRGPFLVLLREFIFVSSVLKIMRGKGPWPLTYCF